MYNPRLSYSCIYLISWRFATTPPIWDNAGLFSVLPGVWLPTVKLVGLASPHCHISPPLSWLNDSAPPIVVEPSSAYPLWATGELSQPEAPVAVKRLGLEEWSDGSCFCWSSNGIEAESLVACWRRRNPPFLNRQFAYIQNVLFSNRW